MYKTTKSSLRKTSPNVTNHTASSRAMPLCQHTARRADTSKHKHARQTRAEHIPHYQQHLDSWQQAGLWSKEWQRQAIQLTGNPTAARIRVPSPTQTTNWRSLPALQQAPHCQLCSSKLRAGPWGAFTQGSVLRSAGSLKTSLHRHLLKACP